MVGGRLNVNRALWCLPQATKLFRRALERADLDPAGRSVSLAALKNLAWMAQASAVSSAELETYWNQVTDLFEQRRRLRDPKAIAAAKPLAGLTVFDVGLGRMICQDGTTTAASRRQSGPAHGDEATTRGPNGGHGWQRLYLDLMKRSLTNYLYYDHARDYERQYRDLLESHPDPRAKAMAETVCQGGQCEAHWDINYSEASPLQ